MSRGPGVRPRAGRAIAGEAVRRPPHALVPPDLVRAALACLVAVVAVAVLFLFPYVVHDYRYPLGWDAPAYVWRAREAAQAGLESLGAIRAGSPLLIALLGAATGQAAVTLVAIVPPLLAGVAALGAAGLARAGLGVGRVWIPIVGFLGWAAFGDNTMVNLHLDNLLNAALVLAGFAAAVAYVGTGRGVVAAAALFAAAGLAHWPFWAFSMAVFVLAVAVHTALAVRRSRAGARGIVRRAGVLLSTVAASGALVAATFLALPESGWVGARLRELRGQLRVRFLQRVDDPVRYYAVPLALVGGLRPTPEPERSDAGASGFFLALMGSWIALTIAGGVAQLLGYPAAGARLLQYLFPVPILAAVGVRALARALTRSPGAAARMAAGALVAAAIVGFGALAVASRDRQTPWVEEDAVRQVAAASAYLARLPASRRVVFVLRHDLTSNRPSWMAVRSTLPPLESRRVLPYYGTPGDYVAGIPSRRGDTAGWRAGSRRVAIVVERFDPDGFAELASASPEREVAPGVFVLRGPLPARSLPPPPDALARTGARSLLWVSAAVLAILYAAGIGWSVALLPPDPVLRLALAPGLGLAAATLAALAWDRAGLPMSGLAPLLPLAIASLAGVGLARLRRRPQARPGTSVPAGATGRPSG